MKIRFCLLMFCVTGCQSFEEEERISKQNFEIWKAAHGKDKNISCWTYTRFPYNAVITCTITDKSGKTEKITCDTDYCRDGTPTN